MKQKPNERYQITTNYIVCVFNFFFLSKADEAAELKRKSDEAELKRKHEEAESKRKSDEAKQAATATTASVAVEDDSAELQRKVCFFPSHYSISTANIEFTQG